MTSLTNPGASSNHLKIHPDISARVVVTVAGIIERSAGVDSVTLGAVARRSSGTGEMGAYAEDCYFADPFAGFKGTERFVKNVRNLGGML